MKYVNPRIVKCFLENSQKSAQKVIRNVALDAKMGTRSMLAMLFCARLRLFIEIKILNLSCLVSIKWSNTH